MKVCPECGWLLDDNAHSCSNCGYVEKKIVFCSKCGKPLYLVPNVKYCMMCGAQIDKKILEQISDIKS